MISRACGSTVLNIAVGHFYDITEDYWGLLFLCVF